MNGILRKFGSPLGYLFISVFLAVSACNSDGSKMLSPQSNGTQGRILVVMSKDKWNGKPGEALREVLQEEILGMPQPEPMFALSQIPNEIFSDVLMRQKNLFIVSIVSHIEKPSIKVQYDRWANPQIVLTAKARNAEEFEELVKSNAVSIVEYFIKAERDRLISAYKSRPEKKIQKALREKYKIDMAVPSGYKLDVDSPHFAWISQETPHSTQALLIWDYPYTDTAAFNLNNLVYMRDSVTMHNVPGPRDGSFMTTEKEAFPIHYYERMINGRYTAELRGLWKTEGAFLGGPFVSHSCVDTVRNRIVTVDGFVYGGKKVKRNLMRQVEAVMHTLDFEPLKVKTADK